ncbi:hypothetical protein T492DRAFT_121162 [Pavlovales sp. CCMP2436]|nr:hypothetical protein T492DRAFT_121162 [Pavlovales sp. CCMP2436]
MGSLCKAAFVGAAAAVRAGERRAVEWCDLKILRRVWSGLRAARHSRLEEEALDSAQRTRRARIDLALASRAAAASGGSGGEMTAAAAIGDAAAAVLASGGRDPDPRVVSPALLNARADAESSAAAAAAAAGVEDEDGNESSEEESLVPLPRAASELLLRARTRVRQGRSWRSARAT